MWVIDMYNMFPEWETRGRFERMSWVLQQDGLTGENYTQKLSELVTNNVPGLDEKTSSEIWQQMCQARIQAHNIISSGCVGPGPYRVYFSGHANVDHMARVGDGTADFVTVSVVSVANLVEVSRNTAEKSTT